MRPLIAPVPADLRRAAACWPARKAGAGGAIGLLLTLAAHGAQGAQGAQATPDPSPHELITARCVAALDVQADALAEQIKAGKPELRPLLLARLKAGGAFVGDAYLKGERDEDRARELLHAAQQAQKALTKNELAARQNICAAEGARMLAEANPLSRAVVSRLAQRRLKKLLEI